MKALNITERKDVRFTSFKALEDALSKQRMDADGPVPIFEPSRIRVGSKLYYFVAEAWFDGCMEDRSSSARTTISTINSEYVHLMEKEARFTAEKHGYVKNSPAGHYGVTWIAKHDISGESTIKRVKSTPKSKVSAKSRRKS